MPLVIGAKVGDCVEVRGADGALLILTIDRINSKRVWLKFAGAKDKFAIYRQDFRGKKHGGLGDEEASQNKPHDNGSNAAGGSSRL